MQIGVEDESRREKRIVKALPIRYSNTFLQAEEKQPQVHESVTFDVSASGLSFRAYRPVDHMMAIRLQCKHLWKGYREGVVRWCAKIYPGIYKVGVDLLQ